MTGTRSCISARSERLLPASAAVRSERDALKAAIGAALSEFTLRPALLPFVVQFNVDFFSRPQRTAGPSPNYSMLLRASKSESSS